MGGLKLISNDVCWWHMFQWKWALRAVLNLMFLCKISHHFIGRAKIWQKLTKKKWTFLLMAYPWSTSLDLKCSRIIKSYSFSCPAFSTFWLTFRSILGDSDCVQSLDRHFDHFPTFSNDFFDLFNDILIRYRIFFYLIFHLPILFKCFRIIWSLNLSLGQHLLILGWPFDQFQELLILTEQVLLITFL